MSQQDKRVEYTIGVKGEGLENLAKLSSGLDDASAEAAQLKEEAAKVASELQTVAQQQQAVDTLRRLAEQTRTLNQDFQSSTAEVKQLAAALPAAAQKTQELATAERQVADAVKSGQTDIKSMQQALVDLRTGSDAATRGTDEYKASVNQARSTIAELREQLKQKKGELTEATSATRAAAAEEKTLQRDYEAAVVTVKKVSSALDDKRQAMDSAKESAKQLGLGTTNLVQAQKQVDQSAREAQQGLDVVAESLRRVQQRQNEAAQTSKLFQEDLRKLGLDGAQAPAGLEQAFRKLGLSGVKQAEAAVHELQVALAQVRNSADVLPADKAAAVATFKQKIAELRGETDKAAVSTQSLGNAADHTGTTLANAAHKAVAWTGALVGLQQLKDLATSVVETGSQFENLEVRLSNLLGSTEAANQAFGMIKKLAAETPFDVAGLTESFVKLTAFGMKPTEAQMRSIADVTANLGGGTETLSGVTLALGQAWTKSKLQGEEILQLAERGVPVWDALAKATGRTVPELQRMSEAGLLGRDVITKLIDELGRMNAGASDKLMNTYAGAVANAKDALAEFFDMIAKAGVLDWLTGKIRELLAEFDRMKQSGELQKKAKEIADSFLQVATMVETATKALIDMAPVIEKAIQLFVAFKAASAIQSLWTLASGARAATTAVAATGAASAVSAAQMTAAATASTGLATSLRILRSLTGVGLVIGAAELADEFFRAKRAAEEADKAVTKMLQEQPVNGPKKAADEAVKSTDKVVSKSNDLLDAFAKLKEEGKKTDEAISQIGAKFDLSNGQGIKDAAVVMDTLLAKGEITATQFNEAWEKSLKGINLLEFEARARQAMSGTTADAAKLQQALDAGLREAIRRAGGDFEILSGGMSKAAQSAVGDTDLIINNLAQLKKSGVDTGQALLLSIGKGINTADSQAAIDAVKARIEAVRSVLGDKIADGLLDQAKKKSDALKDALDAATPGINSVREALKQLGITSDEVLKKTAADAKSAYDVLRESGTASARELSEAFKKSAEAAIAANKGIAPSWVQAEAALRGYEVVVDKAGKSTLRLKGATDDAAGSHDRAANSVNRHTAELERLNAERERGIAAQEKSNELATRELQLMEAKRNAGTIKNVDGVPSFESQAQADAWLEEKRAQYQRDNPFTTNSSGALGNAGMDIMMAEWRAEVDAMKLRNTMKGNGNAETSSKTPLEAMASRQVSTINLQLNGQSFGPVNTDPAGAAALNQWVSALERQKGASA